jgi:hypothetical protein
MFSRKHAPDSSASFTTAVERTFGALVRLFAEAQERGEIIPGDPERLSLAAATSVHGLAAFAANGTLEAEAVLAGIGETVHHLLHGLRPR